MEQLLLKRGMVASNLGEVIARLESFDRSIGEAVQAAIQPDAWLVALARDARLVLQSLVASEQESRRAALQQEIERALATLRANMKATGVEYSIAFGELLGHEQLGLPDIGESEVVFTDEEIDELRRRVYDWVQNEKEWKDVPEVQPDGSVMYDGPKTPENVAEKSEWILHLLTGSGLREGEMQARAALLGPSARGRSLGEALSGTLGGAERRRWGQVVLSAWRTLFEVRLPARLRSELNPATRRHQT